MVRVLKQWRLSVEVDGKIKSLVMESLSASVAPDDVARP